MPTRILVERLLRNCDPFAVLGLTTLSGAQIADPMDYEPITEHQPYHRRSAQYHLGRIRYFVELLLLGEEVDPVEVDNRCWGLTILPEPVILDGHHRLCAALTVGQETVLANYGGRVDVLRWLAGKRRTRPRA